MKHFRKGTQMNNNEKMRHRIEFLDRYNRSRAHNIYSWKDISTQTNLFSLSNLVTAAKILLDATAFILLIAVIYIFFYAFFGGYYNA
jgi:hypothetical protein